MKTRFTLLFLAICFSIQAQHLINPAGKFENADDLVGLPHYTLKDDIEGSPMLMEDWGNGYVKLKDGRLFKDVILKFNLASNELYFQRGSDAFVFSMPVEDCELNYMENGQVEKMYLRSGYPEISNRNKNSLYEVLAVGPNVHFVKYTYKKVKIQNNYGGVPTKSYETIAALYLFDVKANTLTKVKPDKASIVGALPAYSKLIETFAESNKYKFKSNEEVVALVNELNK
jgi:hypothetical protein